MQIKLDQMIAEYRQLEQQIAEARRLLQELTERSIFTAGKIAILQELVNTQGQAQESNE